MIPRLFALIFCASLVVPAAAKNAGGDSHAATARPESVALADARQGPEFFAAESKAPGRDAFHGWPVVLMGAFLIAAITTRRGGNALNR